VLVVHRSHRLLRSGRAVTALAAGALLTSALAACGSSSGAASAGSPSSSATTATAASSLPAAFKGGISVASDISYAPIEFTDSSGKATGLDYDLSQALGQQLGVKVSFTNVTFDGIIPALLAKKYDIVMSAMSDTKVREKQLTFVDYFTAGTSFVVAKGNPKNLQKLTDLCGKHVALEKGTTQDDVATAASAACVAAGKPAATIDKLPKDTDALLEISSGKADVDLNDSPVADYIAAQSSAKFQAVKIEDVATAPYGIGMLRANADLATAIQTALKNLIANGTYAQILTKYGISDGSLTSAQIDGATS
jgi:polar amino acid transport system substrate-binding protein